MLTGRIVRAFVHLEYRMAARVPQAVSFRVQERSSGLQRHRDKRRTNHESLQSYWRCPKRLRLVSNDFIFLAPGDPNIPTEPGVTAAESSSLARIMA